MMIIKFIAMTSRQDDKFTSYSYAYVSHTKRQTPRLRVKGFTNGSFTPDSLIFQI